MSAKIVKLGDVRRAKAKYKAGLYPHRGKESEVIEVTEPAWLWHVEEFHFKYKALRENPGWQSLGYELAEPDVAVTAVVPVRLSWWRRLLQRARIPVATLLARKA